MSLWARLVDRLIYAPRRRIDLQMLWPAVREQARDLDDARAAFALHVTRDKAWTVLGPAEIAARLERLS